MALHEIPGMGNVQVFQIDSSNPLEGRAHAFVLGSFPELAQQSEGPLVRLHSSCLYGEVFQSNDCDCGPQLKTAQERIRTEGSGVLFYLDQEGRGADLYTKAQGYALKESEGLNTIEAYEKILFDLKLPPDLRRYGHCGRFLIANGIQEVRLMTNNPRKIAGLKAEGVLVHRVPLVVGVNEENVAYLRTKRDQGGHLFPKDM